MAIKKDFCLIHSPHVVSCILITQVRIVSVAGFEWCNLIYCYIDPCIHSVSMRASLCFVRLPTCPPLCCVSACLGRSYCSCLHWAPERGPYTRISPPPRSCDIIFPPCQLQPREASSLVTRLLLQQQGQTCTRGIDPASCSVPSHRI